MTEQREFINGAFYWVRFVDVWTVGQYDSLGFRCIGLSRPLLPEQCQEIFLIGKEPPHGGGVRKTVLVGQHSGEELEYVLPVSPDNLAGRSDERAAILAYLRAKSERWPTGSMFYTALADAAEAIERGDHLKGAND